MTLFMAPDKNTVVAIKNVFLSICTLYTAPHDVTHTMKTSGSIKPSFLWKETKVIKNTRHNQLFSFLLAPHTEVHSLTYLLSYQKECLQSDNLPFLHTTFYLHTNKGSK